MVSFLGTETEPSSGASSPVTMRNSVVLPAPLGPTSPTFSPGFNWKDASTKSNCLPYCLLMFDKEIILRNNSRHTAASSVARVDNCSSSQGEQFHRYCRFGSPPVKTIGA